MPAVIYPLAGLAVALILTYAALNKIKGLRNNPRRRRVRIIITN